ncbi:unnamed protein product, partial [Laminaria digitata]
MAKSNGDLAVAHAIGSAGQAGEHITETEVGALAAGAPPPSDLPTAPVPAAPPTTVATPPGTDGAASLSDDAKPAEAKIKQEPSGEGEGDEMENSDQESSEDQKGSHK